MSEDQRDTRERLLDAAEALFAEHGFDAVPVRDIAAVAEVNLAAVNYHFHGKDRLYLEVLRRATAAKRDRHLAAIDASDRHGDGSLEAIVGDFFRTHLVDVLKVEQGGNFLKLFVREIHHGSDEGAQILYEMMAPIWRRLGEAILRCLPETDPALIPWIVGSLHGQLVHFTIRWQKTHGTCAGGPPRAVSLLFPPLAEDVDSYIDRAVEHITCFCVAGIRAVAAGTPQEETT